jgi:hypothetical protein
MAAPIVSKKWHGLLHKMVCETNHNHNHFVQKGGFLKKLGGEDSHKQMK